MNVWRALISAVASGVAQWRRMRSMQRRVRKITDEWDVV